MFFICIHPEYVFRIDGVYCLVVYVRASFGDVSGMLDLHHEIISVCASAGCAIIQCLRASPLSILQTY